MSRLSFSPSVIWSAAMAALVLFIGVGLYTLLRAQNAQAYLGAQFSPLTNVAKARTPFLTDGALILNIIPDGPVAKAGIKPYAIVVAINDEKVGDARAAAEIITHMRAGQNAVLTLYNTPDGDPKPHKVSVTLTDAPPLTAPRTVRPFRPLAKPYFPPTPMVANAAWSQKVAGWVTPSPMIVLQGGTCSALTPKGWKLGETKADGFLVTSPGGNVKAGYFKAHGIKLDSALENIFTSVFGQPPKLTLPRPLKNDFFRVDFGTANGFGGYILYRQQGQAVSFWLIGTPGADVAPLLPLVTSVALSIRCGAPAVDAAFVDPAHHMTAVSEKCLKGVCDEGDLAGLNILDFRMGYVHSAEGENFLINPRVIWQTGPYGPGIYRQMGGDVEKMEPGRTN